MKRWTCPPLHRLQVGPPAHTPWPSRPDHGPGDRPDIWDLLHALSNKGMEVTLQRVPGHAGLDGNEAADWLAGEATEEKQRDIAINLASARAAIGRHVRGLTRGRVAAAHPHPAPTPGHAALPRWENVTLSQLRTGASILTRDTLFRFALASDDKCLKCGEQDRVEHLLLSCPA